ncbi:hypothetical protein [Paraburkholderia sp. BL21I4N1]|uniref:hypothetical protein n=1 Tax=Paraburkholderia sp. BL21I4N1 TaxID=1938801 RepID=UPI000D4A941A|nr:hypothetical protein [Paraburkholderia sp. BL21I4N1]PQV51837.1 hypothetical protein B0G83_10446 [Paraburkholderia sp. BL21I4N1]
MLLYLLILALLAPIAGCLLFVFLAENPNVLTAALGAITGMAVSLVAVLVFA